MHGYPDTPSTIYILGKGALLKVLLISLPEISVKIEKLAPEVILKEENQIFILASRPEGEGWDSKKAR